MKTKLKILAEDISDAVVSELPFFLLFILLLSIPAAYGGGGSMDEKHISKVLFVTSLLPAIAYSTLFCLIIKHTHSLVRWILFGGLMCLFLTETYMYVELGGRLSPFSLPIILQTNPQETIEFFHAYFSTSTLIITGLIILAIAITAQFIRNVCNKIKRKQHPLSTYTLIIALTFGLVTTAISFKNKIQRTKAVYPIGFTTIDQLAYSMNAISGHREEINSISQAIDNIKITSINPNPSIIILVIGESYIKYHSNLYGYINNTCPNMAKEKDNGNLFVFDDVISPFASTNFVLKHIFSMKSYNDSTTWKKNALFPAVFKKAGYKVGMFDNQYTRTAGDIWIDYSCTYFLNPRKINDKCFTYRNDKRSKYDGDFIESFSDKFFHDNKSLNIIHLLGQHVGYDKRYPHTKQWERYNAFDVMRSDLNETQAQIIADYDNATYYNDGVICKIFNYFKNDDAIVIYTSDHGEQAYDDSRHLFGRAQAPFHGATIKCLHDIPFVIWCSDTYIKNHPTDIARIKNAMHKPFSNDDIPYLLLDLAGIKSNVSDNTRSVINKKFKRRDRFFINKDKKYNYDKNIEFIRQGKLLLNNIKK